MWIRSRATTIIYPQTDHTFIPGVKPCAFGVTPIPDAADLAVDVGGLRAGNQAVTGPDDAFNGAVVGGARAGVQAVTGIKDVFDRAVERCAPTGVQAVARPNDVFDGAVAGGCKVAGFLIVAAGVDLPD